jgi:hypothetical protein
MNQEIRNSVRKWLLGRHMERNTKIYLTEIECECMDLIQMDQDRVQWQTSVNMVLNLQVP